MPTVIAFLTLLVGIVVTAFYGVAVTLAYAFCGFPLGGCSTPAGLGLLGLAPPIVGIAGLVLLARRWRRTAGVLLFAGCGAATLAFVLSDLPRTFVGIADPDYVAAAWRVVELAGAACLVTAGAAADVVLRRGEPLFGRPFVRAAAGVIVLALVGGSWLGASAVGMHVYPVRGVVRDGASGVGLQALVLAYDATKSCCAKPPGASDGRVTATASTASDGTYVLHLRTGTYRIAFVPKSVNNWDGEPVQRGSVASQWWPEMPSFDRAGTVRVDRAPVTGVDARLVPGHEVRGRVSTPPAPASRHHVVAVWIGVQALADSPYFVNAAARGPVDADGAFDLRLAPGDYELQLFEIRGTIPYSVARLVRAVRIHVDGDVSGLSL